MNITVEDIIRLCNVIKFYGNKKIICENFTKDTREIKENDVFVGIKGENFNGSDFYKEALEKGANVCVLQDIEIDENTIKKYKEKAIIIVKDTVEALQKIAEYKRSLYNIPVIGVTGSVGKTSTRDIITSIVSTKYNVLKTQGNYNNQIGLPMTILGLRNHEALVVEMGMNNLGEISLLSKIAKPNMAVITNVGTAHIGNLGSRENILKAKLEIIDGLEKNSTLIINNDNDMLNSWDRNTRKDIKIVTYGVQNDSDVMGYNIVLNENSSEFNVDNEDKIEIPVAGAHFVYNALAAIAVGKELEIDINKIQEGIKKIELTKSRMELINLKKDIIVINDCYNANFDSMKAAIEYLGRSQNRRKIAILGDMLELGEYAKELHEKVGEEVAKNNIDILITVGEFGKVIAETAKKLNNDTEVIEYFNNDDAIEKIKKIITNRDIILVKASNGMRFKNIVETLKNDD